MHQVSVWRVYRGVIDLGGRRDRQTRQSSENEESGMLASLATKVHNVVGIGGIAGHHQVWRMAVLQEVA